MSMPLQCCLFGLFFAIAIVAIIGVIAYASSNATRQDKEALKFYAAIGIGFTLVCFFAWLFWGHWDGIMSGLISTAVIGFVILMGLAIYFLPTYVAVKRSHKNTASIVALNLLTGWSFVGWVISLVWALKND